MRRALKQAPGLAEALESRYWSEREAGAVLAAWQGSGESATVFARRHGPAASRLLRWKTRLSGERAGAASFFHLVEVVPSKSTADALRVESTPAGTLELVVGTFRRIVIRRGFDPELLLEVIRVLEAGSC